MFTRDEIAFYKAEESGRYLALRAVLRARGLPDWFDTVDHSGHIYRDWRPFRPSTANVYYVAAHRKWDGKRFRKSLEMMHRCPVGGFRTLQEAEAAAKQINAALPANAKYPLAEEIRLTFLHMERAAVHEAREAEALEAEALAA